MKSTNILRRMMDLQESAVKILSEIVEQEEFFFDKIDPEQQFFLQENVNNVMILQKLGLISLMPNGKGYFSNINVPVFTDNKYDLGKSLVVEESVESSYGVDEIIYPPHGLFLLLKDFFNAEGDFKGVTYMQYFRCRYVTSDGRVRFDTIEDITPENG